MKKTCGYARTVENVDLASETGEVMDLMGKGRENARRFLEPKGNYILVKVTGGELHA